MLKNFENDQKIACKILENELKNNTTTHAYLIETNNYINSSEFVLSFAKSLLCPYKYLNNEKCVDCTQCENIDKNLYTELKIINPDGMWIKKEQTDLLQKDFSTKSIQSDKRVYIINEAEKLNVSSANSLLKFIEEPSDGIVAILVTSNVYNVISTIRSRCQIIRLKKNKEKEKEHLINKLNYTLEQYNEKKNLILNFILNVEKKKNDAIIDINSTWNDYNITRDDYINSFDMIVDYYIDIINNKIGRSLVYYDENDINDIFDKYTINQIIKKINIVKNRKNDIISNGNLNLIMDRLIIELSGGDTNENNWSYI